MNPDDNSGRLLLEDEVLRDGLQDEARIFSIEEKVHLFQLLKKAGIRRIQLGSFVHPRYVPQMADTEEVIRNVGKQEATTISALILNEKGLERALGCGIPHVSMSVSLSDTHSRKNARRPAAEALESMTRLIGSAVASGLDVRAGLQCAFGCVYEGRIPEKVVLSAAEKLRKAGAREINLADTTGMANPDSIRRLVNMVNNVLPGIPLSLHLHDTRGLGLTNMLCGYEAGVRTFDVCAGGLGGCPFVMGAAGNVATEDAVNMFEAMGIRTGIHLASVCDAAVFLENVLERRLPGRMSRVLKTTNR